MYTLKNLLDVIERIVPLASAATDAGNESKAAKEHAADVKASVRHLTAQAVSIGFLLSMGRKSLKAFIGEKIPDGKRKAVNISEAFRVLDAWPTPVVLAKQWAEGDFTITVSAALKEVKPAPDTLASLGKAVAKALEAGETPEAILEAVESALTAPVAEEAESEEVAAAA